MRKIMYEMADGTIRDSMKDYPVPLNEKTEISFRIMLQAGQGDAVKEDIKMG